MQSDGELARRIGEANMQGTGDILCEECVAGKALGCWREGWSGRPGALRSLVAARAPGRRCRALSQSPDVCPSGGKGVSIGVIKITEP